VSRRQCLLPSWIPQEQPFYLNKRIVGRISQEYDPTGIFLNIPYGKEYLPLELSVISTVTAYGLRPRKASERVRMEVRMLKILEMICACRFGLTDLSYERRMNMPFELGILLTLGKETFVTSRKSYRALRTISDLNFGDIRYHGGGVRKLIIHLSRWIEQNCSQKRLSTEYLLRRYRRVRRIQRELQEDFDRLTPEQLSKLIPFAEEQFQMAL
jgi:hypothetical protein